MNTTPAETEAQLQTVIEHFYEDEGLTDALTDEGALILLGWGARQLRTLAQLERAEPPHYETIGQQLRQLIRAINQLVGQHAELSETQLLKRLLKMVEQTIQLTQTQKN